MIRKLLFLLGFVASFTNLNAQSITIGTSTTSPATSYRSPWNPYYGYSYVQTIYLQSEINATGSISSISFYYGGTSLASSDQIKVYMAQVTRASFASTTDWEPLSNLTLVFDGTVSASSLPGVVTINLSTPFAYNNTSNLLIAVDENKANYETSTITNFRGTTIGTNRVLSLYSDTNNPDPAAPTTASNRNSIVGNIQIDGLTLQGCQLPTAITSSAVTATSATASWTAPAGGSAVSQYNWELRTSGAAGSGATGLVNSGNTATTSVNLTSLTAATTYSFYVKSDCGSGSTSAWSSALTITTACNASNLPYTLDFNSVTAPALPNCLSKTDVNADGFTWATFTPTTPTATLPTTLVRYSYNTNGTTAADDWLYTAGLNLTAGTTYQLKFKYKASDGPTYVEKLEVKYGTTASVSGMTSSAIFSNTNIATALADPYADALVTFTVPSTGVYYIGFHAFSVADQGYLYVDDIVVQLPPTCDQPTGVAQSTVTSSSATVSWTAPSGSTVTNYSWELRTSGVGGSGSTGLINSGSTATNTVNLTGLTEATTYTFYVRTNCTSPDVSSYNSATFATTLGNDAPCDGPALTINPLGSCASVLSGTTNGATTSTGLGYTNPVVCAIASSPKDVWYKVTTNASGDGSTSLAFTLTPTIGSTLVSGTLILFSATGSCPTPTLTAVTGACAVTSSFTNSTPLTMLATGLTPSTTYYLRINPYYSSDATGNFTICASVPTTPPTCTTNITPIDGATSVSYGSGVTLNWNAAPSATSYDIYLGTVNPPTTTIATNVAATTYTYNSNLANTRYYWYVVPKNSGGAASGCSSNVTSYTTDAPPPPPANDDCANAVTISGYSGNTSGTIVSATQTSAPEACAGFTSSAANDVWYKFTALTNGDATITVVGGTGFDAVVIAYSGTCGAFTSIGCADATGSAGTETVALTGLTAGTTYYLRVYGYGTSTGTFTISASGAALPVSLISITGERKNNTSVISWATATETNNTGFELQRSADGINFNKIAFINSLATNGNSNQQLNYSYVDTKPFSASGYYRLKQMDKDGRSYLSNVVIVKSIKPSKLELSSVFPNPATSEISVSVISPKNDNVTFIVYDVTGKVISKYNRSINNGDNLLKLDISNLAVGNYTIKATCADGCETALSKFVKL